jgi:hypothetical protein
MNGTDPGRFEAMLVGTGMGWSSYDPFVLEFNSRGDSSVDQIPLVTGIRRTGEVLGR